MLCREALSGEGASNCKGEIRTVLAQRLLHSEPSLNHRALPLPLSPAEDLADRLPSPQLPALHSQKLRKKL